MKKIFALLLMLLILVQMTARAAETVITSASEIDYPPFCLVDEDGKASGFSVELMQAALKAMDRDVTFRQGTWDEVFGWLKDGSVQALPLVGRTPEREGVFDFTFPYMSILGTIVVREDEQSIRTLDDLKGRQVAVMRADNAEEYLRRQNRDIRIQTTPTFEVALRELSQGKHDAVVIQRLVGLRLIQETGITNLKVVPHSLEDFRQDFCFAVKEGDRDTLALLNEGLALVTADGTYAHLHAKWFASLQLPTHRRMVIGGDHNYPPFEYLDDDGQPTGYNVELTRAIAQEMGLAIEIRLGPWAEISKAFASGEIDALQGMFYSPERDLQFDFTAPHITNQCVSVVRSNGGLPPSTVDALKGKSIVVQSGDIMHDFALKNGLGDHLSVVGSQEEALKQLSKGRFDCALVSRLTAYHWIERLGLKNLRVGNRPLLSSGYCYAVPQGRKALLSELSEGLKVLDETGEYRRIHDKWMGVQHNRITLITIMRYALMIAAPLLLLLLISFFWLWSLRKLVARRTRELRQSHDLMSYVIEHALGAIAVLDKEMKYVYVSQRYLENHGIDDDSVIGKHCNDVFANLPEKWRDAYEKALNGEVTRCEEDSYEREDGSSEWERWECRPWQDADGTIGGVLVYTELITERKRAIEEEAKLRDQLAVAQRMESIGKLAGGVAHDFNNILQVITGYGKMLVDDLPSESEPHEHASIILQSADRASTLTRQLLAFARRQTISPRVLDLNETIESMLKMLRRLIGEDVDLAWLPNPNTWPVKVDPAQIDQILANLCVNARDAIQGVGKVTIETGNVTFDEAYCAQHVGFITGDFSLLAVSDDGCGMDRETAQRAFEPFFTTKGVNEGTGLGLATVYGIVKQNKGFINVYSEPGKGSTFRIYLPRHLGEPVETKAFDNANIQSGTGETILLVEDDAAILTLSKRMLETLGYSVLAAGSPSEAMSLARDGHGKIHLLVTDVVMPEMNGRDLAGKLRVFHPEMRVLFMSGYTANVIAHRGVLEEHVIFLPKPFSIKDLATKVREALAK